MIELSKRYIWVSDLEMITFLYPNKYGHLWPIALIIITTAYKCVKNMFVLPTVIELSVIFILFSQNIFITIIIDHYESSMFGFLIVCSFFLNNYIF